MMTVGLFTYSTLPRGSVVHTAHLADALVALGCDVTVYALDKDRRGFFRPLHARLQLVPTSPAPATTALLVQQRASELRRFVQVKGLRHDVIHAQDCLTASALLDLPRTTADPLRLTRTVHHVERFSDAHLARCQTRSIRAAQVRLAVSRTAQTDVRKAFGVHAALVGNGVDASRFARRDEARIAAWRNRLGKHSPVVLAVGGVEERKNTPRILQAFARLREQHPHAQLCIMGGATVLDHGITRAHFESIKASLPTSTRAAIHEVGVVPEDDVPALYQAADVLALPSLQEGFGLAALEALAAGVSVLVSDCQPFTEFLDSSCATLVNPTSVEAIAAGMQMALDRGPSLRSLGLTHAARFSWRRVAERHLAIYERTSHARNAFHRALA